MMQPEALGLRYIVDENLLRLGKALAGLRRDIACLGLDPVAAILPAGIGDSEWIPIRGQRGWIMITNDKRLRTRPVEASLAVQHRVRVIHLLGAGQLTAWDQAVRLLGRWRAIEDHVAAAPNGPLWISVRAQSVRALSFQPGLPEAG